MNHYEVLGISRDADAAAVRRAYLVAARAHHPDYFVDGDDRARATAARRMQEINEAWSVLGDAKRRAAYDRDLGRPDPGPSKGANKTADGRTKAGGRPVVPPGKGWTPRADDTGWQRDYGAWRAEDWRLPEDEPSTGRRLVLMLPTLLVVVALVLGLVGAAMSSRPVLAACFVSFAIAAILFVMLPVIEMTKGRDRD